MSAIQVAAFEAVQEVVFCFVQGAGGDPKKLCKLFWEEATESFGGVPGDRSS